MFTMSRDLELDNLLNDQLKLSRVIKLIKSLQSIIEIIEGICQYLVV
jgi:hypothetical protein